MKINQKKWDNHYIKQKSVLNYPDEQLVRLLNKFKYKKQNAIDIGCGSGRHIKLLIEQQFENIYGLDISINSLKICKNYFNIPLLQASNINMPFKPQTFDVAIAWGSLHYCHNQDTKKMINEIHRILKSGGILFGTLRSNNDTYLKRGKQISQNTWQTSLNDLKGAIISFYNYEDVVEILKIFSQFNIGLMERTDIYDINKKISHWYFAAIK